MQLFHSVERNTKNNPKYQPHATSIADRIGGERVSELRTLVTRHKRRKR